MQKKFTDQQSVIEKQRNDMIAMQTALQELTAAQQQRDLVKQHKTEINQIKHRMDSLIGMYQKQKEKQQKDHDTQQKEIE